MTAFRLIGTYLLAGVLGCLHQPPVAFAQTATSRVDAQSAGTGRDGQHDFDFNIGVWKSRIRRLQRPLTGSKEWVEVVATVTVSKIWQGRANLEEIEAAGPAGHLEGLTLRLYNPESRQWYLYWANSKSGTLGAPNIGEFKNGSGEFYSQDQFNGRTILVRQVYSDITANSYHFEQAFSDDGAKTWEPNWVATLTREPAAQATPRRPDGEGNRQRDFDFEIGTWKTHLRRLLHPLTGSSTWVEYEGATVVRKVWNGRANLVELVADGPAGHFEGLSLRVYNPESRQWSLNFANSKSGTLSQPTVGGFKNGRGDFYDQEIFNGRAILVRFVISDITPNSCRFEQSFSDDGGKTWEVNWVATDTRAKD